MNDKEVLLPFGKTIYQSKYGHGITTDTAFLIKEVLDFNDDSPKNVLDLGSGNGIISIMLGFYRKKWQIVGIEIQKNLFELSNKNKIKLSLSNVNFVLCDLNSFQSQTKFDIIVSNPPYYPKNNGKISPIKERAIARHEIKTNLENILNCIKRNLDKKGYAFIIYPKSRTIELENKIKNIDLKTIEKKIIFQNRKLVLVILKKG